MKNKIHIILFTSSVMFWHQINQDVQYIMHTTNYSTYWRSSTLAHSHTRRLTYKFRLPLSCTTLCMTRFREQIVLPKFFFTYTHRNPCIHLSVHHSVKTPTNNINPSHGYDLTLRAALRQDYEINGQTVLHTMLIRTSFKPDVFN